MADQKLSIAMNDIEVGEWKRLASGATIFSYSSAWLHSPRKRAISLSLPLSEKRYQGDVVYNFFDNLLPDSEQIRSRIQQRFQTQTKSAFDLLNAIGQDCVGAIQLYQGKVSSVKQIVAEPLTDSDIENILQNRSLPLGMMEQDDFRISLAGAQEKTAFLFHKGKWYRPQGSTPTSHIFKLPIGLVGQGQIDLSTSCENEWLCLQILQKFSLEVPVANLAQFGESQVLIVERFDRRWSMDRKWLIRLPQEDMCQALNIAPARKYESDGGAGIVQIMQLLNGSADPINDRKQFFKAQILFWLLCAIDGHAKNFSLFLEPENRYRLTPFYDVTSAYPLIAQHSLPQQKVKMAMAWKGKNNHYFWDKIQPRHIFNTAKLSGLNRETVEDIFNEIYLAIPRINEIKIDNLRSDIVEPIFFGLENKIKQLNGCEFTGFNNEITTKNN